MKNLRDTNNNLSQGWRKVKLREIVEINMGQSPPSKFYNSRGEGLPFYQGITDFGEKYPKKSVYCSRPIKIAEVGDILFSVRAPVGNVNVAIEKSCVGRGLAVLRMKNQNNNFLYFLLRYYERYFKGIAGGTTYESINKDQIENTELLIPEDSLEQKRIAEILSAFDDKIELNNKIIKTLEAMAQEIFKEWFVRNEKLKVKNEKLGTICDIVYGKDLSTRNLKKKGFPVYGGNGIIGYCDKYLYEEPQIIIGCRGAYSGNIFKTEPKSFITHNALVLKLKPEKNISINYLFYALQKSNVKSSITGSAQPQITIAELNKVEIPLADDKLVEKFEDVVSVLENYKFKIIKENQTLSALRDLLLPKLMSGEIRVESR